MWVRFNFFSKVIVCKVGYYFCFVVEGIERNFRNFKRKVRGNTRRAMLIRVRLIVEFVFFFLIIFDF